MNLRSLLEADARFSSRLRVAEKPGTMRILAAVLAHSGDSWFWGLGLALLWWRGDSAWSPWAMRALISIAVLAASVLLIKLAVRRRRPEGDWGAIYRNTDPHSFPSGHAARAVLLAALAAVWGPAWWAAALLLWAPLVALARVAMGLHYLSDVLAGAVLGLVAAGVATLVFGA
jgi:undecaprenyl-diphosphatase